MKKRRKANRENRAFIKAKCHIYVGSLPKYSFKLRSNVTILNASYNAMQLTVQSNGRATWKNSFSLDCLRWRFRIPGSKCACYNLFRLPSSHKAHNSILTCDCLHRILCSKIVEGNDPPIHHILYPNYSFSIITLLSIYLHMLSSYGFIMRF